MKKLLTLFICLVSFVLILITINKSLAVAGNEDFQDSASVESVKFFIEDLSFLQKDIQREFNQSKIRVLGSLPSRIASITKLLTSSIENANANTNVCTSKLQSAKKSLEKLISLINSRICSDKRKLICISQAIVDEYLVEFETLLDELNSEILVDVNEDNIFDVCEFEDSPNSTSDTSSLPVIENISPSSASAGSNITITGVNFTGVTSVKFGNVNAPIVSLTNTSIIVTVPSGSGIVPVTVTASNSTSNGISFTYLAN